MPVEQGLPWHPVATGLAGQAVPFIVTASHAHAPPSAPFWFPVPAVLVASPALLYPSSLSAVLAVVPLGVAPAFCVSVLLLPLSVGAPGCPCRAPPPVPPARPPPVRGFHISVQRGLSRARLAGHGPVATPVAGTSRRAGCNVDCVFLNLIYSCAHGGARHHTAQHFGLVVNVFVLLRGDSQFVQNFFS